MDDEKLTRLVLSLVALVFAASITFIVFIIFAITLSSDRQEVVSELPEKALQVRISPNPGGAVPTLVPTETPEPLQGMDSPMLCKMELAGLQSRAAKTGAEGMLVLNRYDVAADICHMDIKNMAAFGNIGTIQAEHQLGDGRYGLTLKINSTMEDQIRKWSLAALMFFNAKIDEAEASSAIRKALSDGAASSDLFQITTRVGVEMDNGKVIPVKVVVITLPEEQTIENRE